jgi:phenylacetate-coenzyme A ligase PaaK-like adenylate-forming protein
VRESAEVAEYRAEIVDEQGLQSLEIKVELDPGASDLADLRRRIEERFHRRAYLKARVEVVPAGSLQRSEGKQRAVVRRPSA